ncbi:RNA-binding protein 39-like [Mya arenaria]|uniref:RNA-binding protein 39-like n=1 Tax=Mya arenaria TaxID=6604 RepID=UPI0022DFB40B|nr:RNA-binding protein 39-like [Mya arenaria]
MADELDVEAMLEAPYRKEDDGRGDASNDKDRKSSSSRRRSRSRDRDRDRKRSDRDRDRDRDKDSKRSKDKKRSKSRDRKRSRSKDKKDRRRSRSKDRKEKRRSRSRDRKSRSRRRRSITKSPVREPLMEMTPEERDARTVFCMQLSARIRPRDLEEFFSSVGEVKDVRLITDNKTRRSKGISYIEFKDTESVPLAIGLTNQKLLGVPIIVQASQAEKNRAPMPTNIVAKAPVTGPMRLYVGSLHFNITEDMLKGIFEPFGKIEDIKLIRDHETGKSHGYGFITYKNHEDAKKALEQLNSFELAGRPMKVGNVTERAMDMQMGGQLDNDELDRAGIDLGATGRLALMAKLAEGTGFEIPDYAKNSLQMQGMPASMGMNQGMPNTNAQVKPQVPATTTQAPPIATQCFMLSNMFDPTIESKLSWDQEIRDDVIEECSKHGGVLHIFVDKASPQGNVYVKCPTIAAAVASVNSLHGRYFGGKIIQAAYVPLPNYHALFPEAQRASQLLLPSTQTLNVGGFAPPTSMFNGGGLMR